MVVGAVVTTPLAMVVVDYHPTCGDGGGCCGYYPTCDGVGVGDCARLGWYRKL